MRDRRESVRDKVMYGGVAEIGNFGTTRECIVRNISDNGANIEFSDDFQVPREQLSLRDSLTSPGLNPFFRNTAGI